MIRRALRGWRVVSSWLAGRGCRTADNRHRSYRPCLESLEDRWLLSTFTVLNNLDSGAGSLRAAIAATNPEGGDTIDFAPSLAGQTITLTSGELLLDRSLTIIGPGAGQLTVSGNNASGVFDITTGTVAISGLTITGGQSPGSGGGIEVGPGSTATIQACTIANNSAAFSGGGLRNDGGAVTILDSTISGNSAPFSGGISNNNGSLTLTNTTVSGNSATGSNLFVATAGGLANYTFSTGVAAPVTLTNCTFSGNTTADGASADDLASVQQAGGGAATISLVNTILASSAATSQPNVVTVGGTIVSQGHNLSSDDGGGNLTAAGDLPNTDPLLAPLGNYGGPTQTQALLPGSPAIDAGDTTTQAPYNLTGDQRGFARIVNGTIDIGAFETNISPTISGPATVAAQQTYTLTLSSPPLANLDPKAWTISWGDGTIDTLPSNAPTATHVYANSAPPNSFQITAEFVGIQVNPLLVTVLTPAVAVAKAAVVAPGDSTTLDIPGQTGLTATLTNTGRGNQNLTLFVALYQMNPTGVLMNAAAFFDVRVSSTRNGQPTSFVPADTTLIVTFRFPPGVVNPTLLFFDSSTGTYKPVKSSPPPPGVQLPDPAPGEITVVFDRNSFPAITDLGGTVLAIPIQNAPASDPGAGPSDAGASAAASTPVTINTNLSPAVAIALTREGNGVNDAGSGLSAPVTFKSSNNLSLNLTASQDSVAAPAASAVGNEGARITAEQAAQFVSSLGDLKDQLAQTSGMVFRWVSDLAAILAELPPARVPVVPAESMKPDNPEDEETAPETTSASTTVTLIRSPGEEIPSPGLWAGEGEHWLAAAAGREREVAPAWLWAGLALGWMPSYDRGVRSGRRRGLRHEEAKR